MQEKPPIDIPVEAGKQKGSTFAGYVSMTVLPQHVGSAAKVNRLAWVLLTLQAQLHASIKDFKVLSWLACSTGCAIVNVWA